MAKGSPNGPDKILNGVLKVFDPKADDGNGAFKPAYIAPDATNVVQGDVLLSDATDSNDDAETGITAATPKAVKTVNDNAETKLSKTEVTSQTVAGPVIFSNDVEGNKFTANIAGQDSGVAGFVGNASSANKLNQEATINIVNGTKPDGSINSYSINFDGSKTTTFNVGQLDAKSLVDMVPLASIPKAALERLINVTDETARFALTTDDVQLGDTVYQNDTGVMYLVVDDTKLNSADGYQEYKAGSAVTAMTLGKDTIGKITDEDGDHYQVWYLEEGQPKKSTDTIGALDKPVYVKDGILTPIEEIKAGVSGVKGDWETEYRDGDVNLTYEDIPAIGIEEIDSATLPDEAIIDNVYDNNVKLTNYDIVKVETESMLASPLSLEREIDESEPWYQVKVNTNIKIDSDISKFATATYFSPAPSKDTGDGLIIIDSYNRYEENVALERQEDGTASFYLPKIYASQVVSNGIWVTYNTSTSVFQEYEFTNGVILEPGEFSSMGVKEADNFTINKNIEGVQEQTKNYINKNFKSVRFCITTEKDATYTMIANETIYDKYEEEVLYNIGDSVELNPSETDFTTTSSGAPLSETATPGQAFAYTYPGSYTITVTVGDESQDTNIRIVPKEKDQLVPLNKVKSFPYVIQSIDSLTTRALDGALCYCMLNRDTNTKYYCYNDNSLEEIYGTEGANATTIDGYMMFAALPFGNYVLSIEEYPESKYDAGQANNGIMMGGMLPSGTAAWEHSIVTYNRLYEDSGAIVVNCHYSNGSWVSSKVTLNLINSGTNEVVSTSSIENYSGQVIFENVPFIPEDAEYKYKIVSSTLPSGYLVDTTKTTIPFGGFVINQSIPSQSMELVLRKQCTLKVTLSSTSLLQDGQSLQIYVVEENKPLDIYYHYTYTRGDSESVSFFTLKEDDDSVWGGFNNKQNFYVGVTNLPSGIYCKQTPIFVKTSSNTTDYSVTLNLATVPTWPYGNDYRITTCKTIFAKSNWSFDFSFEDFTKVFDGYGSVPNPSGFAQYLRNNTTIRFGDETISNFTTSADFNNKTFNISCNNAPSVTGEVRIDFKSPFNDEYGVLIPGKMYAYIVPYIVKTDDDLYWEALVPHKPDNSPLLLDETVYSNSKDLGLEQKPYNAVYADKFHGVADNVDKTLQITGAVRSDPISLKEASEHEIIPVQTSYPTGQGIVMISATQPTDPNVLIWIQP